MKEIILASSSPRRKKLMKATGLSVRVVVSKHKEIMDKTLKPAELVQKLALEKAQAVGKTHANVLIIGSDTFVVLGKEYLGKATSKLQAKEMLKKLSNKQHIVITGIAVLDSDTKSYKTDFTKVKVWVKKLSEQEIDSYIAKGAYKGKAGAYAMQEEGAMFIEKIQGNPAAAIGLPVLQLLKILKEFGISIL